MPARIRTVLAIAGLETVGEVRETSNEILLSFQDFEKPRSPICARRSACIARSLIRSHSRRGRTSISLGREEAIPKDTAVAAARYNIDVRTVLRAHSAAEQAILQEIRSSNADLVVLGVDRIAGEKLDFGGVAHAMLTKSNASVLLIAHGDPTPKG